MTKASLSIEAIYVPGFQHPVHSETYLQSLSDTEWTELRTEATRSRHRGDPALLCGDCRGPVYGRESTAGRRHCYHFGTDIKDCRWAAANASNFRLIDASKFGGNQEGERHKNLKAMICEILKLDSDPVRDKTLVFLTNNFALPAMTVADIYRSRWQVELFFKWIKQHLRVKSFLGTSANAVKTRNWIAVSVYVLVAIIRKRVNCELSLRTILQILDVTCFEKTNLNQLFTDSETASCRLGLPKQLTLFDC